MYDKVVEEFYKTFCGQSARKASDVPRFVATIIQSSLCQGNTNLVEDLRKPRITDSCKPSTVMCLGMVYGTVVYDPVTRGKCL